MRYAFAAPIPRGKTEAVRRFMAELLGPRKAGYDDLQRRSGITEEAYWLQEEEDGSAQIIVVSDSEQDRFWEIMANPETEFDRWYRGEMEAIWEFDASQPPGTPNELLGVWSAAG